MRRNDDLRRPAAVLFSLVLLAAGCGVSACSRQAAKPAASPAVAPGYPVPRYPAFASPPATVEEVLPYVRAAVRQRGGRSPLGLVKSGQTVALFADAWALVSPNPLVLKAFVQAYRERNVKTRVILPEPVNNQVRIGQGFTSRDGYMEVVGWISRWPNPEEPKAWLRERNEALYNATFPSPPVQGRLVDLDPDTIRSMRADPTYAFWSGTPKEYMDAHGEGIDVIFAGYGGRTGFQGVMQRLGPYGDRLGGNFIFDHYLEVMNDVPAYPGDVWLLVEEKMLEPIRWVDRAEVTDPEGSNFSFDVSPELAQNWAEGAYLQGHLFMFPHQATAGRRPFSMVDYPKQLERWIGPMVAEVSGVLASTKNHTGVYPRMEVVVERGRVKEVRGGGQYGDLFREFLHHPTLQEGLTWPYYDRPGYWFLYEAGTGTNPKFVQRTDELRDGRNLSERNVAGVIHWSFGAEVDEDAPDQQGKWLKFIREHNVPYGHGFHMHNLLPTYKVRLRRTDKWTVLIDHGRVMPLDDPETRALASRYGDPDRLLRREWVPDIPGVTRPGDYKEYARDPWSHILKVIDQIDNGTYEYLVRNARAGDLVHTSRSVRSSR